MYLNCNEVFDFLLAKIEADPKVAHNTIPGLCRIWTDAVMDVIEREAQTLTATILVEARETEVEPCYSHTFVQLSISVNSDHQDYILDGVGASSKAPYIGIFEDAPMHLKRSFPDPINLYREPRVKDMLTEYALQLRNHFAVKTLQKLRRFYSRWSKAI